MLSEILNKLSEGDVTDPTVLRFLNAPTEEEVRKFNRALNSVKEFTHKSNHVCAHGKCRVKSCDSHEISKSTLQEHLADYAGLVSWLIPDYKNNSFSYVLRRSNVKGATTFSGYCSDHDAQLFSSIDNSDPAIDYNFVCRQALRVIRKEIAIEVSVLMSLKVVLAALREIPRAEEAIKRLKNHLSSTSNQIVRHRKAYRKLWRGMESDKPFICYKTFALPAEGLAFSSLFSPYRYCVESGLNCLEVFFVFIVPGVKFNTLILASFDDEASRKFLSDHLEGGGFNRAYVNQMISMNKERLVFSDDYIGSLNDLSLKSLLKNNLFTGDEHPFLM